jgi:hypothetical protein
MSIIRIEDVKKLRFGPGERVDCKMGQGVGTRWCPGTIVALHYRENDWETGYCAAYQVRDAGWDRRGKGQGGRRR